MLELEAAVLSKSALKPPSDTRDQPSAAASGCSSMESQYPLEASVSDEGRVFFRVFEVAEGGPAQAAGLIDGDTVRRPFSTRCF
jgi:hypothetical protein